MFDWMKFVILASILLKSDEEEYIRAGISRYYYGIFGIIRRYLINVKHNYYLNHKSGEVHYEILEELRLSDDITEKEISKFFNKLRKVRNQADYDDNLDIDHFKKFLKNNENNFEVIVNAIEYFKNHPNY